MMSVILLCLFGFTFGAPNLQNDLNVSTENKKVELLTASLLKIIGTDQSLKNELREELKKMKPLVKKLVEALSTIKAGDALTQEDVEILSELLIGLFVKLRLSTFNDAFPGVDTEKLREKGFNLETLLEEISQRVLACVGVENLLKAQTREDVEALFSEALSQEDVEQIFYLLKGLSVNIVLSNFNDAFPGVETEKLLEKGLDLETLLEEVIQLVLTRVGVENLLKAKTAEDMEALLNEAFPLEEVKMIGCKALRGADVKAIGELFGQDLNIDDICDEGVRVLYKVVSPVIGPTFYYSFALDNGIAETRIGSEGPNGTSVMKGSFTIPLDGGDVATFTWTADKNGYRIESPYLPTPPPTPPHVAELLRIAEEQRKAGITFD